MKENLVIINSILDKRQKRNIVILFFMVLVGAGLETIGVSSILPLVSAIMSDNFIKDNEYARYFCELLGIENNRTFLIVMMVGIIVVFVVKESYMLLLNYAQYRFIYNGQVKMTSDLFDAFMHRDYEFFLNSNYNYISKIVRHDVVDEYNLLLCMVKFVTEAVVFVILSILLFVIDAHIALVVVCLMAVIMLVIFGVVKPIMKKSGDTARKYIVLADKWMYQGFNGIKDVKIAQKEKFFIDNYHLNQKNYSNSQRTKAFVSDCPTYIMEGICIVGVVCYMITVVAGGADITTLLPQISAFAVAAVRLLPSANRMNGNLNNMAYYKSLLKDLDVQLEEIKKLNAKEEKHVNTTENIIGNVKDKIELKGITFSYQEGERPVFIHADMEIPIGKSVAVVGPSGAGKTTAVDIMLGLLKLQKGEVLADGKNIFDDYSGWISHVGYIPQTIYLTDDSIKNNVAFGVPEDKIDVKRVWKVLEEAQIKGFVESLNDGIMTEIGDRGVRLSGGQRQRLGIARALYDDPEILVFDEATSALDNDTESAIMESINYFKGKKTLVIIAHRLATVENCDIRYRVAEGKIVREEVEHEARCDSTKIYD